MTLALRRGGPGYSAAAELPEAERLALEAALRAVYGLEVSQLTPLEQVGCPN